MYDKEPIVISFGGLIGRFENMKMNIDKDVNMVAHVYIIKKN